MLSNSYHLKPTIQNSNLEESVEMLFLLQNLRDFVGVLCLFLKTSYFAIVFRYFLCF